jgi:hypothetical protein
MDADGVAEWIQTVLPDKTLAKQYADGLRDGFVDGVTMDTFPMGGDELTDYGIQKMHCRVILANWAKLSAGEGEGASADPPVPPSANAELPPQALPVAQQQPRAKPDIKQVGSLMVHFHELLGEGSNDTLVFRGVHIVGSNLCPVAIKVMKRSQVPEARLRS